MKQAIIAAELRRIQRECHGVLRPEDVVSSARPANSPLHGCFTWDDSEAAREYRLWEARQLIRVTVAMLPQYEDGPVRAFVSLMDDRTKDGGGYRLLVDVLRDPEARQRMLTEAMGELAVFERKYKQLTELGRVFAAAASVRRKIRRKVG